MKGSNLCKQLPQAKMPGSFSAHFGLESELQAEGGVKPMRSLKYLSYAALFGILLFVTSGSANAQVAVGVGVGPY